MSWEDCQTFLKRLGEKCGRPEGSYRLPTEAQWELACRAGSEGKWSFGDTKTEIDKYAWYKMNAERKTHPVGQKRPRSVSRDKHGPDRGGDLLGLRACLVLPDAAVRGGGSIPFRPTQVRAATGKGPGQGKTPPP